LSAISAIHSAFYTNLQQTPQQCEKVVISPLSNWLLQLIALPLFNLHRKGGYTSKAQPPHRLDS